ncbi:MAG: FAD-dependent oxidoreductase [Smithellaceae bacterium]|nr:FAD-dependent oxidoreductase [Smithellaceae bacterium]
MTKRGTSPCKAACPAETSAQGYVALIKAGRYREALDVVREYNPFPRSVGRVCNHPCESECNRGQYDSPVAICQLKRFVADWVQEQGEEPSESIPAPAGERVAVVGAGPAGLSAAFHLARMGYRVTVYEALPVAGGMMRVGIPSYRLPREVLQQEIEEIIRAGVDLRLSSPVRDIDGLFAEGYRAVFLAIGAHEPQRLGIPGEDALGVYHGVTFLQRVSLNEEMGLQEGYAKPDLPVVSGRTVVVGGGNTAIDAARTALRLGSSEVYLLYRRSREEMPANPWEVEEALHEGVKLELLTAPVEVLTEDGRVRGVRCIRMELGEADESGRRRPVAVKGSEYKILADQVIAAVAQAPEISFLDAGHGLEVTGRGTFGVDKKTMATSRPGVFAGGDVAHGPWILIQAIADGRRGALSIDRYLRGAELLTAREELPLPRAELSREEMEEIIARGVANRAVRVEAATLPMSLRLGGFGEVELGLSESEALLEAGRCLECGICSECHLCVKVCKADAVDHQQAPYEEDIAVGSVIAAPGYSLYRPELSPELGYGRYANVLTSMEFERMLSASGPYGGHIERPSDHSLPRKIAFLQCVGSRTHERDYCSAVCCMYAAKEALLAQEHLPGVECRIFQMDMRAYGKGFDSYWRRVKERGVGYVSCRISGLEEDPLTRGLLIKYMDDQTGMVKEESFDLVVLSVGMAEVRDASGLADALGIELNADRFCLTRDLYPLDTTRPGVFACGTFTEPKDIPDSVIQASGAAAQAMTIVAEARGTMTVTKEYPPEAAISRDDALRIGAFICSCGTNIAGVVDVAQVVEYAKTLPGVVCAENYMYTCSADSLKLIQEKVRELNLNRVVVASCTPRTHEPLFRDSIREAGLNPYLFEMANIRDQCSWVHPGEKKRATEKAKNLVRMAVSNAGELEPLYQTPVAINHNCLVIGGGPAGMVSALSLADQGFDVVLVERTDQLGGRLQRIHFSAEGGDPRAYLAALIARIERHPRIEVLTGCQVTHHKGAVGNFQTMLTGAEGGRQRLLDHAVTIIATGGREYRGPSYLYGTDDRVITQEELEGRIARGDDSLARLRQVVFIQCVGPWDQEGSPDDFYCSRICCTLALKNALLLKERFPGLSVAIFYRDMRSYGFKERIFTRARAKGVQFIRFEGDKRPLVIPEGDDLVVGLEERSLGLNLKFRPDLLVLSAAALPGEGSRELANIFKVPLTLEGFFLEAHVKLRPVDFTTDGIYLAGMAHYPKTLNETIAQAQAAAARATTILSRDTLLAGGVVAKVDGERCAACLTCVRVCPYEVPVINASGEAEIDILQCKGCGSCVAECPARAIDLLHFRDSQLVAKSRALMDGMA